MAIWPVLGILAIICISASLSMKRNAIWAGLQAGVVTSVVVAMIMKHDAINSPVSKKIVVASVLAGTVIELMSRFKRRRFYESRGQ